MQTGYPELDVISNVPTIKMSGTNITANTTHIFMDKVKVDFITGNGFHLTNLPIQSSDVSITSVDVSDAEWNILGYTAVDTSGGYIVLTGEGFGPGSMVQVDTTNAIRVSYVSSNQSHVQVPPKPSGSYDITMIRGDGEMDTLLSGLTYSSRAGILFPDDKETTGNFGSSVAMSADGTIVVIGAYKMDTTETDSGAAYVFEFTGSWVQKQKLVPDDPEGGAFFGSSCAMSADGSRIIIGAPKDDSQNYGAAYIFEYSTSEQQYTQQTKIVPPLLVENSYFAELSCGMSNNGTKVIIAARTSDAQYPTTVENTGAAYIFSFSNGTWALEQELLPTNRILSNGDRFGWSCDISGNGNRAVVGASLQDGGRGAVYIFVYDETKPMGEQWVDEQRVVADDPDIQDYFGDECVISDDGETLVVGATFEDTGGLNSGAIYIYTWNGTEWTQEEKETGFIASSNFGFSCAVSADGQRVIVGTSGGTEIENQHPSGQGQVYIYSRDGTQSVNSRWTLEKTFSLFDQFAYEQTDVLFGYSVAMSADGESVIAGARDYGTGQPIPSDAGTVYIMTRTPSGQWEFSN